VSSEVKRQIPGADETPDFTTEDTEITEKKDELKAVPSAAEELNRGLQPQPLFSPLGVLGVLGGRHGA
jgi:hypothetical protein